MVLFTYLKIILLQCFQFSIFNLNKISSIQTDPGAPTRYTLLIHTFAFLLALRVRCDQLLFFTLLLRQSRTVSLAVLFWVGLGIEIRKETSFQIPVSYFVAFIVFFYKNHLKPQNLFQSFSNILVKQKERFVLLWRKDE